MVVLARRSLLRREPSAASCCRSSPSPRLVQLPQHNRFPPKTRSRMPPQQFACANGRRSPRRRSRFLVRVLESVCITAQRDGAEYRFKNSPATRSRNTSQRSHDGRWRLPLHSRVAVTSMWMASGYAAVKSLFRVMALPSNIDDAQSKPLPVPHLLHAMFAGQRTWMGSNR